MFVGKPLGIRNLGTSSSVYSTQHQTHNYDWILILLPLYLLNNNLCYYRKPFFTANESYARIISPHSILSAVLVSHIKSQVTWETQPGTPAPRSLWGTGQSPAAQQGRTVRNWLESTNPHPIQAVFGKEILILEEILILFFPEVMCDSLKCSNCYLLAPDNRQVLGPLSFG